MTIFYTSYLLYTGHDGKSTTTITYEYNPSTAPPTHTIGHKHKRIFSCTTRKHLLNNSPGFRNSFMSARPWITPGRPISLKMVFRTVMIAVKRESSWDLMSPNSRMHSTRLGQKLSHFSCSSNSLRAKLQRSVRVGFGVPSRDAVVFRDVEIGACAGLILVEN